jgi:hypothetical protein
MTLRGAPSRRQRRTGIDAFGVELELDPRDPDPEFRCRFVPK